MESMHVEICAGPPGSGLESVVKVTDSPNSGMSRIICSPILQVIYAGTSGVGCAAKENEDDVSRRQFVIQCGTWMDPSTVDGLNETFGDGYSIKKERQFFNTQMEKVLVKVHTSMFESDKIQKQSPSTVH